MSANLGSAQGELLIDVQQALANLQLLESRLKGMDSAGSGVGQGLTQAGGRLDQFGTKVEQVGAKYRQLGLLGLGVGAAVAGGFGLAVGVAANFEAAMDGVGASLGGVGTETGITKEQFQSLNEEALRIGATTSASANEAALVMDSLAKSGIGVEEIYNGVAQGVVNVSEATGEGLQASADAMGSFTNLFRDTGISAEQMADTTVNAMNASNMSLSEFQTGIARLAPVIAGTGMSFQDSAAAIAYFNSQGFSAAEVGTSLTAAYNNLINPTKEQAEAQQALGIAAFDSQGNFVGFPAIMDQVAAATAGMTDEQRAATLATLFGADALDVMTLAAKNGGGPLRDYETQMSASGTAALASAQRMDNLKGSLEQLRGAIETAMIVVGSRLIPVVRAVADALAAMVQRFLDLPGPIQTAIAAVIGIAGALAGVAGAIVVFGPQVVQIVRQMGQLAAAAPKVVMALRTIAHGFTALLAANPIILLIVAALAALALAYKFNLFGFRDAVNNVAGAVVGKLQALAAAVGRFVDVFRTSFKLSTLFGGANPVAAALTAMGAALDSVAGKFGPFEGLVRATADEFRGLGRMAQRIGNILKGVSADFGRLQKAGFNPVSAGLKALGSAIVGNAALFGRFSPIVQALGRGLGVLGDFVQSVGFHFQNFSGMMNPVSAALAAVGRAVQELGVRFPALTGVLEPLGQAIKRVAFAFDEFVAAARKILDGDFSGALDNLREGVSLLGQAFRSGMEAARSAIASAWDALSGVDWGGVLDTITGALGDLGAAILSWLGTAAAAVAGFDWAGLWENVKDVTGTIVGKLGDLGLALALWVGKAIGGIDWGALWSTVKDVTSTIVSRLGDLALALALWVGKAIGSIDWGALWSTVKDVTGTIVSRLGNLAMALALWVGKAIGSIDWGSLWGTVKDVTGTIVSKLGDLGMALALWIGKAIGGIDWGALWGTVTDVTGDIVGKLGDLAAALSTWVGDAIDEVDWGLVASNIGTAISTAIETTVDFAQNIKNRLLQEFNQAKPSAGDLANWAAGVAGAVVGAITSGIQTMVGFASSIKSRLIREFNEAKPSSADLASWASSIASTVKDAIVSGIRNMVGFAAGLKERIVQEFNEMNITAADVAAVGTAVANAVWEAIKSAAAGWDWMSLVPDWVPFTGNNRMANLRTGGPSTNGARDRNQMSDLGPVVLPAPDISAVTAALAAMNAAVNAAFVQMGTAASIAMTALGTIVSTRFATMSSQASSAMSAMAAQVGSRFSAMSAQAGATASQMASQVQSRISQMSSQVTSTVSQMASQVQSRLTQMSSQATSSANQMRSSVTAAMSGMASQASAALNQFASAVQSSFQRAVSAAQSGVSQIRSTLASASSGAYGYGYAVGDQFASGLEASLGRALAAAAAIRNAMPSSPAKVGPLSRPISFAYIAEDLDKNMERLGDIARTGARNVMNGWMELLPSGNMAAMQTLPVAGRSVVYQDNRTFNTLKSEELVRWITNSEIGADFARELSFSSRR